MKNNLLEKKRIWELDFIRGLCIILMVLDHCCISMYFYFDDIWSASGSSFFAKLSAFAVDIYAGKYSSFRNTIRPLILFLFFSMCGMASSFSKNNFARGIKLFLCAMLYSAGSWVTADADFAINFGVLHMLSACILIWAVIAFFIKDKYSASAIALFVSLLLYAFYNALPSTGINLSNESLWNIFTDNLAKRPYEISPGDYFAVLPNICLFLLGAAFSPFLYPNKKSLLPSLEGGWSKPIEFVGRHSLIIMLFHIIIVSTIFALITALFVDKGNFVFF